MFNLNSILKASAILGFLSVEATCLPRASASTKNGSSSLVASTYFAGYHVNKGFPVADMPFEKYTDVKYAFAETEADGSLNLTLSAPDQIPAFVSAAKAKGVKAMISIGGWTGSRYFSSMIGSAENRTAFVKTCVDLVNKYSLDGLDFDWEYPNRQGLGCNVINKDDTANYLAFLQELRKDPKGKSLWLTAAGSLFPWYGPSGASSTDLGAFASVLDYVMIMNYDIYGAWAATAGPNAPLEFACDKRNNQGGGKEGVAKWAAAGLPMNKIVLAVAAYGHSFSVTPAAAFPNGTAGPLNAYPAQNSSNRLQGGSWDSDPPIDPCGAPQPHSGTWTFRAMIEEGKFLDAEGNPSKGMASGYDSCSQTPFLYDQTRQTFISYDNAKSLAVKGEYVKSSGLAGFATFEAGGDYKNILVDAIRGAVVL
ncbi:hypothetical protein PG999_000460 [Apiospora kogelbergensis]|uniref:chitinase n=1 Tax=Apiospora kogelbergensis TaxID=1337665 RepID=A0AAW0RBI7_9PEZI